MLVDDLITHGTTEPYRMFTSRAEYRLQLREDNADLRLTAGRPRARPGRRRALGAFRRQARGDRARERAPAARCGPRRTTRSAARSTRTLGIALSRETNALDLLQAPGTRLREADDACPRSGPAVDDATVAEQVEIGVKYAGYLDRQRDEIARQQRHEDTAIPADFDYAAVRGLSAEVQQKLERVRPQTIGQAQRIPGMTPAAISLLLVHLTRARRSRVA